LTLNPVQHLGKIFSYSVISQGRFTSVFQKDAGAGQVARCDVVDAQAGAGFLFVEA